MDNLRGGALAAAVFLAMAAPAWAAPVGGVNPGVDALAQAPAAPGDKQAAYDRCLQAFRTLNDELLVVLKQVTLGELPADTLPEHELAGDLFALLQTITGQSATQEMNEDPTCIPAYLAVMREQTDLLEAKLALIGPTRYARFVTGLDEALRAAGF